jgi:DNA polymerase-4
MKLQITQNRKIIHCDADCFFAALEMRDDPSLRGIPMAVGGDPNRRGVISTCNYEARALGVRSALASAYAKKLCPQLIIIPHNMAKYRLAAEQLKAIFLDFTDEVESLSLDEAFLDVSGSDLCNGSATLIARDICLRVQREIGITASAGVAPNKFLAKVASDWDKPNGLTVVEPSRVKFFLNQLPINCIPGVGQQTQAKLQALGINMCTDILPFSDIDLVKHFGKFGLRLHKFARGEDDRVVVTCRQRKSMSVEHTFDKDLLAGACMDCLHRLQLQLQERLQRLSSTYQINKVFIKIKFMDFSTTTIEVSAAAMNATLYQTLFQQGWERYKKPVRLVGVGVRFAKVLDQQDAARQQLDLF